jgi:G3E family GTPase
MTDKIAADNIHVTILTGYRGAGKTTLLNRILSDPQGQKYAVIVNEFGEIENDLIVGADEEIFEMNNGCICCTVRSERDPANKTDLVGDADSRACYVMLAAMRT